MKPRKIVFIVEKTATGYSAYAEDYNVFTTGDNMKQLKKNMLDAINTWLEHKAKPLANASQIEVKLDIPQLFKFFPEISAKGLSKRANMNDKLISQYATGKKTPSEKQSKRLLSAIRDLATDLNQLELI